MALAELMGVPGMTPEQNQYIKNQQMMGLAAALLQSGAPSTNPQNASMGYALGKGIENMQSARQGGLSSLVAGEQFKKLQEEQAKQQALKQAMAGIPTTEESPYFKSVPPGASGPPSIETQTAPRNLASYLTDVITAQAKIDPMGSLKGAQELGSYQKSLNTPDKEFNIPGDVDSFLAAHFPYDTPGKRMAALNEFRKPDVKHAFMEWKREMAMPFFQVVPTDQGLVPFNSRTGQPGAPIGNKPNTGEMITTNQQIGTLTETLGRVKQLYNPDFVGPVAGRTSKVRESTTGLPDEQAAFYSNLAQVKNSLIYLMSGKQINESEYKRLSDQLPDRNLPSGVFKTRMDEFERTMNSIINERQKSSGGYGGGARPVQPKANKIGRFTVEVE